MVVHYKVISTVTRYITVTGDNGLDRSDQQDYDFYNYTVRYCESNRHRTKSTSLVVEDWH